MLYTVMARETWSSPTHRNGFSTVRIHAGICFIKGKVSFWHLFRYFSAVTVAVFFTTVSCSGFFLIVYIFLAGSRLSVVQHLFLDDGGGRLYVYCNWTCL